ncbi:hypothetical protein R3P38DRAFT_3358697 [Favolaschia claudopus]|uniref:Uncharacterized protein n=1 Tax=Favolaschia claudopus TaxID=2862362 RepID=A0AAW0B3P7_9AGAR
MHDPCSIPLAFPPHLSLCSLSLLDAPEFCNQEKPDLWLSIVVFLVRLQCLDQTPPTTPQRVRGAAQQQERESRTLDSPQRHRAPPVYHPPLPQNQPALGQQGQQVLQDVFGGAQVQQPPRLTPNTLLAFQERLENLRDPLAFNPAPYRPRGHVNAVAGPSNANPNRNNPVNAVAGPSNANQNNPRPVPPPRDPEPPRATPNTVAAIRQRIQQLDQDRISGLALIDLHLIPSPLQI